MTNPDTAQPTVRITDSGTGTEAACGTAPDAAPGAPTGPDPDPPRYPVKVYERDRRRVRSGFWPKVRVTLGRVPFVEDAVAAYYCATDRKTPTWVRATLMGALAYFVVPSDMIPDFVAGLGFTDDATVLLAALRSITGHLTDDHRARARKALSDTEGESEEG